MKVRVLYKASGITVIYPAPKSRRKDESEENWLNRVFSKATPNGVDYDNIDSSELPTSREFRDAWIGSKGQGIKIDQNKIKKIKRERLIQEKEKEILKRQAIQELINEGKIDV